MLKIAVLQAIFKNVSAKLSYSAEIYSNPHVKNGRNSFLVYCDFDRRDFRFEDIETGFEPEIEYLSKDDGRNDQSDKHTNNLQDEFDMYIIGM